MTEDHGSSEQLDPDKLQYQLRLLQRVISQTSQGGLETRVHTPARWSQARNLASRGSIGRERGKGGRRGKREQGGRGTVEVCGGSVAAAGGDDSSAEAAEGSAPVRRCCRYQGHTRANCTEKLCSRCIRREHTADVCLTSKEETVLALRGKLERGSTSSKMVRSRLQLSRP